MQRRKVVIIRNVYIYIYIAREREIHDKRGIINVVRQTNRNLVENGYTLLKVSYHSRRNTFHTGGTKRVVHQA